MSSDAVLDYVVLRSLKGQADSDEYNRGLFAAPSGNGSPFLKTSRAFGDDPGVEKPPQESFRCDHRGMSRLMCMVNCQMMTSFQSRDIQSRSLIGKLNSSPSPETVARPQIWICEPCGGAGGKRSALGMGQWVFGGRSERRNSPDSRFF
jgi:hypothetical protein